MWAFVMSGADPRRGIQRVADDPVALDEVDEPIDELVRSVVDDQPRPGRAVLAHVPEDRVGTRSATRSRFAASAMTTCGALPAELERDALEVRLGGVLRGTVRPTSVEPVNATPSIPGWRAIAVPTTPPGPVTTFRTPSGRPASAASSATRRSDREVTDAGFITTALPVARIGPSFRPPSGAGSSTERSPRRRRAARERPSRRRRAR